MRMNTQEEGELAPLTIATESAQQPSHSNREGSHLLYKFSMHFKTYVQRRVPYIQQNDGHP